MRWYNTLAPWRRASRTWLAVMVALVLWMFLCERVWSCLWGYVCIFIQRHINPERKGQGLCILYCLAPLLLCFLTCKLNSHSPDFYMRMKTEEYLLHCHKEPMIMTDCYHIWVKGVGSDLIGHFYFWKNQIQVRRRPGTTQERRVCLREEAGPVSSPQSYLLE